MIDLKRLREDPDRYREGTAAKGHDPALVDRLLDADARRREMLTRAQGLTAEKNRIGKEIGQLAGRLKKADSPEKAALQEQMQQLQQRPNQIKTEEAALQSELDPIEAEVDELLLLIPQPADTDVPTGRSEDDNVELRRWSPDGWDDTKSFEQNMRFAPRSHIDLMTQLGMVDFERGVKISGSRSYVLTGPGMLLHQAILRYAFDFMVHDNAFMPVSVADLVRHPMMVGTGFFPHGREQVYDIANPTSEEGLALSGTGEVGLMGIHADEILDGATLPRCYTTVSTCFRREAGAAGKDTAGLYRIHQFDKVEQVVLCRAEEAESRAWHAKMIRFVETLLQSLRLPYRLIQCCTGDLGPKNADQVDLECWMPSRESYGETHSASRLYDYQCRRLNIRYKDEQGRNVVAHSLNNTVAASPRILIPIVEMYQTPDGEIAVPPPLRPYMKNLDLIRRR